MQIRALWVEDEPDSVRYEWLRARELGWDVQFAQTVEDALAKSSQHQFDVVIADLILPRTEYDAARGVVAPEAGLELLQRLRTPRGNCPTPTAVGVIVVTAVISPELRDRVVAHLASEADYIEKPIEDLSVLEQAFSRASATRPDVGGAKM